MPVRARKVPGRRARRGPPRGSVASLASAQRCSSTHERVGDQLETIGGPGREHDEPRRTGGPELGDERIELARGPRPDAVDPESTRRAVAEPSIQIGAILTHERDPGPGRGDVPARGPP